MVAEKALDRALLILDLDETLIFATATPGQSPCDFRVADYSVYKRPHLDAFLDQVFEWFEVAVWTSSSTTYAAAVVSRIFACPERLRFVWDRERCTLRRDLDMGTLYHLKDLKKVKRWGYPLQRVLMIDDTPQKLSRHYGNHLMLSPFEGDPSDRELLEVLPYLGWLNTQRDFRSVNKRRWRQWKGPC